ncbi:conjugative transposon protein TraM [Flavobacterium album]|uniref:Conjugative transposon protein TraM n=1 Tax=Flavobacterium album TaxID=2175091 RepID=A0A2S1R154_9FLAO|nr:conjugative transposon protein TraM [Flavobacterium album]AWH86271.1 conjugative transposon protein TraM [Flavobacterium album]
MKEKQQKPEIFISEGPAGKREHGGSDTGARLKKYGVIGLMVIAFAGCLYMIFSPSQEQAEKEREGIGANQAVPQASEAAMPSDKGKAYEQELLKERDEEKSRAISTLSDYWQDSQGGDTLAQEPSVPEAKVPGLESYRNARQSLGSFYRNDESSQMKEELESLRRQLAEGSRKPPGNNLDSQLALMEKSYQMASKYFPGGKPQDPGDQQGSVAEEPFEPVHAASGGVVSLLGQVSTEGTSGDQKNGIRACVHQGQIVIPGAPVQLRLMEPATFSSGTIRAGSLVTALAKFDAGRLQLQVTSLVADGSIVPVSLEAYDTDGQKGLHIPYNPEAGALNQIAGNMAGTGGTSIMMTRSAGQQMAADLGRGVVQGVSGYFSKRVKLAKVHLPASYELYLVSKK